jgi:hypothetical protein
VDKECVVFGMDWNVVDANKGCRDPECRCRDRRDVCFSDAEWGGDFRECLRAVQCNEFSNPCPDQPHYSCDQQYNYSCLCIDDAVCGPTCLLHEDCQLGQVCDPVDSNCKDMDCVRDSDCPAGSECAYNGSRFCSLTGPNADGETCDNWWDCQSGMCIQLTCANPCADQNECPADLCQAIPGSSWNDAQPFCFAWPVSCGCSATQFCAADGTCYEGPACSRHDDCPSLSCNMDIKVCNP